MYLGGCGKPEGAKDTGYAIFFLQITTMKKSILITLLLVLSISCFGDYSQVITIKPTSEGLVKNDKGFYEYENSDLKITYSFWADQGVMAFIFTTKQTIRFTLTGRNAA